MKKIIPVLLFAIVSLFYSCDGREQQDYIPVFPTITATNNGQSWQASLADTLIKDSLILHAQWKHELLRLKFPVSATGNFTLEGNDGKYYITDDSGRVTRTFKLDPTYPNSISVTLNGAPRKSIGGHFSARFIIDSAGALTDTTGLSIYTFTSGQYIVPVK